MSVNDSVNVEGLQRLQDEFANVTNLFCYCLDSNKNKLTHMSGDANRLKDMSRFIGCNAVQSALERVEEGSLEDIAIEDLEMNQGKVAAFRVFNQEKVGLYFILLSPAQDQIEESALEQKLDLLKDMSEAFCKEATAGTKGQEGMAKKTDSSKPVTASYSAEEQKEANHEDTIRTIETTTQVVRLLDSNEPMERIFDQFLGIVAPYIEAQSAQIFRIYDEKTHFDVVNEYLSEGTVSAFDITTGMAVRPGMLTDKPLILDRNTLQTREYAHMRTLGTKTSMIFPLIRHEKSGQLVLFFNRRMDKAFTLEEVRFATDSVKLLQNIVIKRIQKNSLSSSYASLEAVLDNLASCIYVEDMEGKLLFCNKKLQATFDREIRDGSLMEMIHKALETHKENIPSELYHKDRDRWYDFSTKKIIWMDESTVRLYTLHDITDKKQYQKKIEQQAYTDYLTGLYNRMCCERDLARFIDEAKQSGKKGALLYMDLDDFKHINDALGHQYGDALLKAISHSLLRIQGIENTCYRMGGDEFVIIVAPDSYPRFEGILEDIKGIFAKPWFLKDADYYCTMSMGIVIFPELGESVVDLVKKADIAMYEAKKSGKNRVARYSDDINSISGRRLDMERNMRDATTDGYEEFEVYYQPIIDITDEIRCSGAEALIRWNSSKLGFIAPSEFIPLAEYLGLINPIGNFVLREACTQCKKWNDLGKDYKVNVNLSVVQLLQPDIVTVVKQTLVETGLNPAHLTLEVTESLAINDMERMKLILAGIKELGVKLALDDFGTGYSSLNHIREIPFDVIKVDQSFVKDLAVDAYAKSFVKMVAELAEAIGVNVCVEGIESIEQYDVLQGMNIKYIQGYYFDKPLTREKFEEKYL